MPRNFLKSMNKKIYFALSLTAMITLVAASLAVMPFSSSAAEQPERKIVVFKSGVLSDSARENLISKFGAVKIKNLDLIGAKAVMLSPRMAAALAREQAVARVDDDVAVEALEQDKTGADFSALGKSTKSSLLQPAEVIPWGIKRVKADTAWAKTVGAGIKVGIIDTGISNTHPDLSANIKGGVNTIISRNGWNDDNGHGTHVAGTVAAIKNTIGVVGVGPQINLYAIKVLDRNGSGYLSDVIEGLDWAIQNKMQVVNMSLGANVDVQSFHDAVRRANAAGVVQVAAAGNSGGAVGYPAAYPEVIAVSATDSADTIANWSSRGPQIALAAPGVAIYSTYKGAAYATLSGTSMASPHVAGTAALVLSLPATCDLDLNGVCSPAEVAQRLEKTAQDLGAAGKDDLYGYGLVNAAAAVGQ